MINSSLDKQLSILLPNTNKALAEALKSATKEELSSLSKHKDLGSVLLSLFERSATNTAQNATLLELLKNNPTLKDLANVGSTLKNLQTLLSQEKTSLPLERVIKNILSDIANISDKELKSKLQNSGVFLESKIKANAQTPQLRELLSTDLKAVLLKTQEQLSNATTQTAQEIYKQVERLLLQIDYFQLSSHLGSGSSLYLPYSWDALEEGNITLKKGKEDSYFCDIELQLKEYGELKLRLGLFYGNQLSINITTQSSELKERIKEHLKELKTALLSVGVTPLEIRFIDEKKESKYADATQNLAMGFEVKV